MVDQQQAVVCERFGPPDVLAVRDHPVPEPVPTEVRVRVAAAGINPVDAKTRAGGAMAAVVGPPPVVLGWDVAGVVDELGRGVTRLAVGDRVMGLVRFPRVAGAYAQQVVAPSRQLVRVPDVLDDAEAGALPMAALTAWQALVDVARLEAGHRLVVLGAGGGVGHLAVQIGRSSGAHVTAVAGPDKQDLLRHLAVDVALDHAQVDLAREVADADIVLDLVGGDTTRTAVGLVRPGGTCLVAPGRFSQEAEPLARERSVHLRTFMVEPDQIGLDAVAALVSSGQLRPVVTDRFGFDEVVGAHERIETGRTAGKLVLVPPT
jgi:NADPH:quinone reductase-like Zn-dependent oxidoreductase